MSQTNPLVIYHANCYDGFTAAWVARRAMPDCELLPAKYGDPPPHRNDLQGRRVYVIDFSYPRDQMVWMDEYADELVVLDHHKTAQEACEGLDFCTFDMNRSGCRMAWDHFFPHENVPVWLLHIEDRDLWRWKYGDEAKRTHAYVASLPMTLEHWDDLDNTLTDQIQANGRAILQYIDTYCEKAAQESRVIHVYEEPCAILNVPYQNASEIADVLLVKHPECKFSMGWFQRGDGKFQFSLRSRGDFDVSEVAKKFGGGGHAGAAGFEMDRLPPEITMEIE